MNEWFLARAGAVYGPYRIEQLREMNLAGELLSEDYFCLQGTESWVPQPFFVAEQCTTPQPDPKKKRAAKAEPKPDWRLEPPSEKQTVYLVFLGFPAPTSKGQAADLIEAASYNSMLDARRDEWIHARLKLYPELYAEEVMREAANKVDERAGRAEAFRDAVNDDASDPDSTPFKRITLQDAQTVISYLDSLSPGWDVGTWGEQRRMHDRDLRDVLLDKALALRVPDKLKKSWRWKFEL